MKKFISIILTLALVLSIVAIGAVSVSAAEIKAPSWEQKNDNKVYFYADSKLFSDFTSICLYIYEHGGEELLAWGSKKGKMTNEGDNVWSFDFSDKGIQLDSRRQYGLIFTADWNIQTCDLIFSTECLGDMAYCDGRRTENAVDYNKNSLITEWVNADRSKYAPPISITSMGNVIGEAYWADENAYSLFMEFLTDEDDYSGLGWIIKFSGMSARETAEHVAEGLGLSDEEFDRAVEEAGIDFDDYTYEPDEDFAFGFDADDLYLDYSSFSYAYAYIYDGDTGDGLFDWGSNECRMEYIDGITWYYRFADHDLIFDDSKNYYVIFTLDWVSVSTPLALTWMNYNDLARPTGETIQAPSDGKQLFEVEWESMGPGIKILDRPEWEQRDNGKIYFWSGNFDEVFETPCIDFFTVDDDGFLTPAFFWDANEFEMTYEAGDVWSFDLEEHGIDLDNNNWYFIQISLDWTTDSENLLLTSDNIGDMVYFQEVYYYSDDWDGNRCCFYPAWVNFEDPFYRTPGDLNYNGELDIQDVTILQQHLAEFTIDGDPIIDEDNDFQMYIADYNEDGDLTIEDVTAMQRSLAEFSLFSVNAKK